MVVGQEGGEMRALLILGYLSLALWLMVCPLMWMLRDGLGPNSVETNGWAVLRRFVPMLFVGLALSGFVVLLRLCERKQGNTP